MNIRHKATIQHANLNVGQLFLIIWMDISKLFSLITPLVLLSLVGVLMILYGFVDMNQENNVLQFFFGIPIAGGAIGLHFLVRRIVRQDTLYV